MKAVIHFLFALALTLPAQAQLGPPIGPAGASGGGGGGGGGVTSLSTTCPTSGPSAGAVTLSSKIQPRTVTASPDTIVAGDCAAAVIYNSASPVAVTVPQAGTAGFLTGFFISSIQNIGAGTVTLTTTSANFSNNGTTSFTLTTGQTAGLVADNSSGAYLWNVTGGLVPLWAQTATQGGNTSKIGTISGSLTSGHGIKADASGNLVDTGSIPGTQASDVQIFTTAGSFTWNKPSSFAPIRVRVFLCGSGGGGGSGPREPSGTASTGGAAGGGGACNQIEYQASDLGGTEAVVVGAGGTAGNAQTVDGTIGNAGGAGNPSSFGTAATQVRVTGGSAGGAGSIAATTAGGVGGSVGLMSGSSGGGGVQGTVGNGGTAASTGASTGGGAGAGQASTPANTNGGAGGAQSSTRNVGATGGVAGTATAPQAGLAVAAKSNFNCSGAGGGGGYSLVAGGAVAGAAGGSGGGGGGGGGASLNSNNSGAGAVGGDGCVVVVSSQ